MKLRFLAAILAAVSGAATAQAASTVIKPTSATASSFFNSDYDPLQTIDGSGLTSGGLDVTAAHDVYQPGNHWTTAGSTDPAQQWIDFLFAAPMNIGAFYVWNHQSNGGIAGNPGYDVTSFDLTFFDIANAPILSLQNLSLAPDTNLSQRFDFALQNGVSRVRFDIDATQSSPNFTGLAEVAFDTRSFAAGAVPEPATWAMLIAGFGMAGGAIRSARRAIKPTCSTA